jgi:hypothetical protein
MYFPMKKSYEALLEAIRTKCQQNHWFGPDESSPLRRKRVSMDNPNRFGFVFPPATEEQLHMTEILLDLPLPPLLRTLYVQIANGGFGTGTGLRGVVDGYGKPGTIYPDDDETIVGVYQFGSRNGTIDLAEQSGRGLNYTHVSLELPYGVWPKQLLPICDLGCVKEACIDSQERMFIAAPIDSNEVYWLRQLPWSFEEWLWRWIRGEKLASRDTKIA